LSFSVVNDDDADDDDFYWCRYAVGSGAVVLTAGSAARRRLNVGDLHRVVATVDGHNGSLVLDDGAPVVGSSRGLLNSLNVQSMIYVGSVPSLAVSPMYATATLLHFSLSSSVLII